jgi:hypothetical protein|nr:MAG TPA: hypothetical protein [Caudoviricetes sp.]
MTMSNYLKVQYWNGQRRYIKKEQGGAIEAAMASSRPFRLCHVNGVDLVHPRAISFVTEPTLNELREIPRKQAEALPERQNDTPQISSHILYVMKLAIKAQCDDNDRWLAKRLRAKCTRMLSEENAD